MASNSLWCKFLFSSFLIGSTYYLTRYFYKQFKKTPVLLDKNWKKIGVVKKIYMYPLKSGRRVQMQRAKCTKVGVTTSEEENDKKLHKLSDRCFAVYTEEGRNVHTATMHSNMLQIETASCTNNQVVFKAPGMPSLNLQIPERNPSTSIKIKIWKGEQVEALDCGDEAAKWFSMYILKTTDRGLRLAYNDQACPRDIRVTHAKILDHYPNLDNSALGLFSNLSCMLVVNQKSVDDLNERLEECDRVEVENFRPNIVIEGPDAYAEDEWSWIKIGENVVVRKARECTRCLHITINPDSGERNTNREPLKTLEKYRKSTGPEKKATMGIDVGVKINGSIKTGDFVYAQ